MDTQKKKKSLLPACLIKTSKAVRGLIADSLDSHGRAPRFAQGTPANGVMAGQSADNWMRPRRDKGCGTGDPFTCGAHRR